MNGTDEKSSRKIYLDTNATTPLEPEVLQEIHQVLRDHWANPSSGHQKGLSARAVIEKARRQVACMLTAQCNEIVFTSGGTESNNLAITSALHHYKLHKHSLSKPSDPFPASALSPQQTPHQRCTYPPNQNVLMRDIVGRGEGVEEAERTAEGERVETTDESGRGDRVKHDEKKTKSSNIKNRGAYEISSFEENGERVILTPHIITTPLEHDSVMLLLKHLHESQQAEVTTVAVVEGGVVDVEEVVAAIRPNTCLISVMLANNETGVLQPVKAIGSRLEVINEERQRVNLPSILLHSDAAQAIGKVEVNVEKLKVNYLTVVGHKYYGPRIGALFYRDAPIHAMLYGGGQEGGRRPGTENTGMIAGLGKASELVCLRLDEYARRMERVRDEMEKRLEEEFPGDVVVHGKNCNRLPNTTNLSFRHPALKGREVVARLKVVEAGVGAACHSGNVCRPSPILLSCGVPSNLAINAIRLSVGRDTSLDDVDHVLEDLKQAIQSVLRDYER